MKKFLSFIIIAFVLMFCAVGANAENGKVTYDGISKEFIFEPGSEYSPTDLFSNFKDVMPGDSISQQITVKNDASKEVKVKIFIRSLGAHEDSVDFLSQLHLRVEKSEENEMAYMFDAAASETAQLTDWVCLGTLYSGGEVNLNVILDVPVELDNSYQNRIGYLDWEFMVEEYEIEDTDPLPPGTSDTSYTPYLILLAAAIIIIILIFLGKKKKNGEFQNEEK